MNNVTKESEEIFYSIPYIKKECVNNLISHDKKEVLLHKFIYLNKQDEEICREILTDMENNIIHEAGQIDYRRCYEGAIVKKIL